MKPEKPQYLPSPGLSRKEMEKLQYEIAEEAVFEDNFDFPRSLEDVKVAGIDQAFIDEKAVSGVVVMENGEVMERGHGVAELEISYIPGLLAFREGSCIIEALESLSAKPDLLMLDGSGRIHFRQAGIATHIGVLFDIPAIGVAKKLLCGRTTDEVNDLDEGERVPVVADDSVETGDGELIGYAYQSRQTSRGINPLYISSGHRVSEDTAVDLVEKTGGGYKLPEPTRLADKYVDKIKQRL